jgi:hypothetical protein
VVQSLVDSGALASLILEIVPMQKAATNPSRLDGRGESVTNKLPSTSRKQRKRRASKRRRAMLRHEDIE